jgi:hypothetical protein
MTFWRSLAGAGPRLQCGNLGAKHAEFVAEAEHISVAVTAIRLCWHRQHLLAFIDLPTPATGTTLNCFSPSQARFVT